MAKKKSKSSLISLIAGIVEIALIVLLFCTLAMSALKSTGTILGQSSTSMTSMTDFIKGIFDGDVTDGWAITALVMFFLTLLCGLGSLVLVVLNMVKPNKKFRSVILEVLLLVFAIVFLIAMIVYASTLSGNLTIFGMNLANAKTTASWAPIMAVIASAGTVISKVFNK